MKLTIPFLLILLSLLTSFSLQAVETNISCVFETLELKTSANTENYYHLSHSQKANKWYFWRTENVIEVANEDRKFGEKWIKTNRQTVYYQKLYHDKKFLLDFQPTDLKILEKHSNWETHSTLLPKKLLQQLDRKKTFSFKNYTAVRYEGKIAGIEYQVDWVLDLQLPARIEKTDLKKKIVTELKEIYPLDKTPYKQISTEKYDDMDFADIGDNESHPVVSQLQKTMGSGYFHQH